MWAHGRAWAPPCRFPSGLGSRAPPSAAPTPGCVRGDADLGGAAVPVSHRALPWHLLCRLRKRGSIRCWAGSDFPGGSCSSVEPALAAFGLGSRREGQSGQDQRLGIARHSLCMTIDLLKADIQQGQCHAECSGASPVIFQKLEFSEPTQGGQIARAQSSRRLGPRHIAGDHRTR